MDDMGHVPLFTNKAISPGQGKQTFTKKITKNNYFYKKVMV
jgi:hypothetical protein